MASIIKVDNLQNQPGTNIVSKCGTDVTIGASGDTVALASGASQTGFGRTGTVDWITTPKVTGDSPVTGVTGKGYFLNTTAGTITINLPAGSAGDIVSMADYAATWQTYAVTVSPNGSEKIGGTNNSVDLSTVGQSVTFVYVDSTQGWINTMDSTSNVRANDKIVATGGTPACGTICGDYKIHTFLAPGTFCVSAVSPSAPENAVDWLVMAGGGGGGNTRGGGGGAGGYRESPGTATGSYTASPIAGNSAVTVSASPYSIVVGAGGVGGVSPCAATQGDTSTFSIYSSAGGGTGGIGGGAGGAGGSGGGGSGGSAGGAGDTPSVSPAQGFAGGLGDPAAPSYAAGGGGGALAVGVAGSNPAAGAGGPGATSSIDGTPTARAGGGGGSYFQPSGAPGAGGTGNPAGIGGSPGSTIGGAGANNTGGGGGGGWHPAPGPAANEAGGNGGSGVVILRYKFQ